MIISHELKFIFFCVPKTGTTSLEKALEGYDESIDLNNGYKNLWVNQHLPPSFMKGFVSSDMWNNYFKFLFVRNPFDWVVSSIKYQAKLKTVALSTLVKKTVTRFT
jgi:hypothetical protein